MPRSRLAIAAVLVGLWVGPARAEPAPKAQTALARADSGARIGAAGAAGAAEGAAVSPAETEAATGLQSAEAPALPPAASARTPAPAGSVPAAPSAVAPGTNSAGVPVRLNDVAVFNLRAPWSGKSAEVRARDASEALKRVLDADKNAPLSITRQGDVAVILVGRSPIVELSDDDRVLAGHSSLDIYAAGIAAKMSEVIASERRRALIAKSVFSVSLLVFLGLVAFYLLRKVGEFTERAAAFLDQRPDRHLSLRFLRIEILRPATLRSSATLALGIGKWLGWAGIAYAWLVVVLSMFDATRNYTQRLTGFVLGPLSQLMERIATALPLLLVAALAGLAVFVLVRFVGLFFASVARGETPLPWLPADLAAPTSVLLRAAIVLAALVFAAPVVTGDANGALGRAGAIVLAALGLASTPILASVLLGIGVLFGRRLRIGEFAEFAGRIGRVSAINLLEVRLLDAERAELRVPHLLSLFHPLRVLGAEPRLYVNVSIAASAEPSQVRQALSAAAAKCGVEPRVEIVAFDADRVQYRLSARCASLEARQELTEATLEQLRVEGIALAPSSRLVPE